MKVYIGKYPDKGERKVKVKIHKQDLWNLDSTLAYIIVPALKAFKKNTQASPFVDDEDVPERLQNGNDENCGWYDKWMWVLDEMIFAFESNLMYWEDQFYSGNIDITWEELENNLLKMGRGENDTFKIDREGLEKYQARIDNGRRLFAKYYEGLWD